MLPDVTLLIKEHLPSTSVQGTRPGRQPDTCSASAPCHPAVDTITFWNCSYQQSLNHPTSGLFPGLISVSFHDTTDHSLHENGRQWQEDGTIRPWESAWVLLVPWGHHLRNPTSLFSGLAAAAAQVPEVPAPELPEGPEPVPHGAEDPPGRPCHSTESNTSLERWKTFLSTQTHQKRKSERQNFSPSGIQLPALCKEMRESRSCHRDGRQQKERVERVSRFHKKWIPSVTRAHTIQCKAYW